MPSPFAASRLRRLAQHSVASSADSSAGKAAEPEQRCDLCAEPLPDGHRHLLDVSTGSLSCACPACGLLFDHQAAGGGHYRLIRTRPRRLPDFRLDEVMWAGLGIPVDLAFFVRGSGSDRVTACYPGPMGLMRSTLELESWQEVEAANPELSDMATDVEALLVNRVRGAREHWLLPLDECYRLAAVMRMNWQGFGGGDEVWQSVQRFFDDLSRNGQARIGGGE